MLSIALSRIESPVPIIDNARDTSRRRGCRRGRARSTRASRVASRTISRGSSSSTELYTKSNEEKVTVRST